MLTAYTDRDICEVKYYDEEYTSRPLTDEEVRGNLWETFVAGIDTVNTYLYFIAMAQELY
ncbi:hypothetical protein RhiirC2_750362 [Rhizophagus irregularis]|uniref:Uncharacterized protein n=1 Tax=Rhizophagus irregularis TaxID=588596 RepID=A0A2N1N380_9GLOM|nr:hypothetical protein RhiirC2_750362 [Rhizophagus irregularis]